MEEWEEDRKESTIDYFWNMLHFISKSSLPFLFSSIECAIFKIFDALEALAMGNGW